MTEQVRSSTQPPASYVVVDLETTGLSPVNDRILEIGAVKVIDGQIADTLTLFCDPEKPIPYRIRQLTGITQDMVEGQLSQSEGLQRFLDFSGDLDLMGHNLIFDYSCLKQQAVQDRIPWERKGIDTLKIARKLLPDLESRSLTSLCAYFQIDRAHAHRAIHDALATYELYTRLLSLANEEQYTVFLPKPLNYKAKRQSAITPAQKGYLNDLLKYHKIEQDIAIDSLTKSEASKKIDSIIAQYGRIKR